MNDDLTTLIIKELGKFRDRKEIVRKVCEQSGLNWKEAEQLTVLVEARYKRTAAARQTPLSLFLSIGIIMLGVGLLAYSLPILMAVFQRGPLTQILNVNGGYYRLAGFLTGVGMTTGGMMGLWKALIVIFPY